MKEEQRENDWKAISQFMFNYTNKLLNLRRFYVKCEIKMYDTWKIWQDTGFWCCVKLKSSFYV